MDKFQESENEGRRIFESLLKQSRTAKNWNPTNDRYNFVDGFFELKDKKIVVEIKTRDRRYADYPSHLMQIDKYMNLTKAKIDNSCSNGIYVNIFGSDTGKRWKKFYEIPVRYAQIFKKDGDKWKQINK